MKKLSNSLHSFNMLVSMLFIHKGVELMFMGLELAPLVLGLEICSLCESQDLLQPFSRWTTGPRKARC